MTCRSNTHAIAAPGSLAVALSFAGSAYLTRGSISFALFLRDHRALGPGGGISLVYWIHRVMLETIRSVNLGTIAEQRGVSYSDWGVRGCRLRLADLAQLFRRSLVLRARRRHRWP